MMIRTSLAWKFILALMLVSLTVAALVVFAIRQMSVSQLQSLIIEQEHALLAEELVNYYERVGSWDGLERYIRQQYPPGPAPLPPDPGAPGQPMPASNAPRGRYAIANAEGRALLPLPPNYRIGEIVSETILAQGTPVLLEGTQIATIIDANVRPLGLRAEEAAYLQRTNQALLQATLGALAVAALLGVLLTRPLLRPIRELTRAAQAMRAGELAQQVTVRTRDELGQLAETFNQMSADLVRANEVRRQMTADIAHDLRTPLTVIAGYLESMQEGVLPPTPARLRTIYQEVEHLQHLVTDLHTLARADAGELELYLQEMPASTLLQRAANAYFYQAEQKRVTLEVATEPDLPLVQVDEERMAQVLGNLVSNALRYTDVGGVIRLGASNVNGQVRLQVADNGSGIAPEHLPHIFDRFYRADQSRQEDGGESGLGLAIARSLVEAHGGRIWVRSKLAEGTVFELEMPAFSP
ncbi:MAG: HAMP domain-containing histidine kinase [Anaerolineales bacterium]|nr:HAMP domain-containing histidine kinase [Anaerolineales bacterium]